MTVKKVFELLLGFLEKMYAFFVTGRNKLYDCGLLKSHSFPLPVVSVGNLLVGGTGKTPIVNHLVDWAQKNSLKTGVILRGYKGHFSGVRKVDINDLKKAAHQFGDEACFFSLKHPKISVFVGKDKKRAVKSLLESQSVDFMLADDAFQHRSLARALDVVVVDALFSLQNLRLLPLGRSREPLSSLKRAHFVILNRVNLISQKEKEEKIVLLKSYLSSETPIIKASPRISSLVRLSDKKELRQWKGKKIFLASGIGQPASFPPLLKQQNCEIVGHRVFKDHHSYSLKDVKSLVKEKKRLKADLMVITEKDAVKLFKFPHSLPFFWMSQLKMSFDPSMGMLEKEILKRVKRNKEKIKPLLFSHPTPHPFL